jgi:hypothetical protein
VIRFLGGLCRDDLDLRSSAAASRHQFPQSSTAVVRPRVPFGAPPEPETPSVYIGSGSSMAPFFAQ